jgi:uncharacterized protein involved in exopolysaccharide biosynthesis
MIHHGDVREMEVVSQNIIMLVILAFVGSSIIGFVGALVRR